MWSSPIHFITQPKLLCKLLSVAERQIDFIVWRDVQLPVAEGQNILVWKPQSSEHQLAVNGNPCAQPFSLESKTSTMLTLDSLAVDTEYVISVRDHVESHWQTYREILRCETVPYAPQRPTLMERKGANVAITWQHRRNLPKSQYLYVVEMALEKEDVFPSAMQSLRSSSSTRRERKIAESGTFMVLGYTTAQVFRLQLQQPIDRCFFRVKVCKTNQTLDGDSHPIREDPTNPQNPTIDEPSQYVWSSYSPVAHYHTPSVPDHPTGLHIVGLTHCSAVLKWNKPANSDEHSEILYRVYLNNSYSDKFSCIAETDDTVCHLNELLPNCHYRVAVSAESAMGTSVQNNTLHFSTRVLPVEPPNELSFKVRKQNPLNSTLPPRTTLKAPKEFLRSIAKANLAPPVSADDDNFSALLDERATTVLSTIKLTAQRHSPPRAESAQEVRASARRQLPPLPSTPPLPDVHAESVPL